MWEGARHACGDEQMHPVNARLGLDASGLDADVAQLRSVHPGACPTAALGAGLFSWTKDGLVGTQTLAKATVAYTAARPVAAWEEAVHLLLQKDARVTPRDPAPSATLDTESYLLGGGGIEAAVWSVARLAICLPAQTSALLLERATRHAWEVLDDEPEDQPTLVPAWDTQRFVRVMASLPAARVAMFDAAHAYLRALGLLYDTATGRMALRPHNDLLFYAPPLVRTRLLRAVACMELMAALDAPRTVYPLRDFCTWYGARIIAETRLLVAGRGKHATHCDAVPVFNLLAPGLHALLNLDIKEVKPRTARSVNEEGKDAAQQAAGAAPAQADVEMDADADDEEQGGAPMEDDAREKVVACSRAVYLAALESVAADRTRPRPVVPLTRLQKDKLVETDTKLEEVEIAVLLTLKKATGWMRGLGASLYDVVAPGADVDWLAARPSAPRSEPSMFTSKCPICGKEGVPRGDKQSNVLCARFTSLWAAAIARAPVGQAPAHPILRDTWSRAAVDVDDALDVWDTHCLTSACAVFS